MNLIYKKDFYIHKYLYGFILLQDTQHVIVTHTVRFTFKCVFVIIYDWHMQVVYLFTTTSLKYLTLSLALDENLDWTLYCVGLGKDWGCYVHWTISLPPNIYTFVNLHAHVIFCTEHIWYDLDFLINNSLFIGQLSLRTFLRHFLYSLTKGFALVYPGDQLRHWWINDRFIYHKYT